jgi:hypothetical protein
LGFLRQQAILNLVGLAVIWPIAVPWTLAWSARLVANPEECDELIRRGQSATDAFAGHCFEPVKPEYLEAVRAEMGAVREGLQEPCDACGELVAMSKSGWLSRADAARTGMLCEGCVRKAEAHLALDLDATPPWGGPTILSVTGCRRAP